MKVRGGRGKEALYFCCVYMPTEGSAAAVIEDSYEKDVLETVSQVKVPFAVSTMLLITPVFIDLYNTGKTQVTGSLVFYAFINL